MEQPPPPASDPPPPPPVPAPTVEPGKTPRKSLLWVFVLVGCVQLLCCACCGGGLWWLFRKPAATHVMTRMELAQAAPAVQAGDIEQTYLDSISRGDTRFRGKLLRVAGLVANTTRDSMGQTFVALATSELNQPVVCIIGPDDLIAPTLKEGDSVIIAGTCDGYNTNHVRIKDAFVVEVTAR